MLSEGVSSLGVHPICGYDWPKNPRRNPKFRNLLSKNSLRIPVGVAMMPELNSKELLQQYQDGQSEAATALFNRYVERLLSLARSRIGAKLKRRIAAEDVVQSAYRSFFVHAKDDRYQLERAGDLWRLLASITLNKLRKQVERQTAAKRSVDDEVPAELALLGPKAPEPSAAEVVGIVEELHLVLDQLQPSERVVLTARLQGKTVFEICDATGKSERTVRRLLAEAKRKIEKRLLHGNASETRQRREVDKIEAPLRYSDYVLEKLVGSGGMGKVFRAREKRTGNLVAIKALHKVRQDEERSVSQFVQEAQILSKLVHPNIIRVQGLGQFPGGGYFLVMDFIDGDDLKTWLAKGPLPVEQALPIVRKVVEAVSHAHANGIIHCDLKPANVLLDKRNEVFVTDFGFAYLTAGTATTTSIGGTSGYLAPELFTPQSKPTPAADCYSIGALFRSLMSGSEPRSPSPAIDESVPPSASKLITKCLAEDPKRRYRTLSQLRCDLQKIGE